MKGYERIQQNFKQTGKFVFIADAFNSCKRNQTPTQTDKILLIHLLTTVKFIQRDIFSAQIHTNKFRICSVFFLSFAFFILLSIASLFFLSLHLHPIPDRCPKDDVLSFLLEIALFRIVSTIDQKSIEEKSNVFLLFKFLSLAADTETLTISLCPF
jgi:hypothetical protein